MKSARLSKTSLQVFSMKNQKEDEEIVVQAPPRPVVHPEKKVEKDLKKALEEERFGVFQVSRRVGELFSVSVLISGVLLLCLFAYIIISGQTYWIMISSEMTLLGRVIWVFVALVNIIGGLLLMGSK
jgi:hypothetical protein